VLKKDITARESRNKELSPLTSKKTLNLTAEKIEEK